MDIRIGILNNGRELSFESNEDQRAVEERVEAAVSAGTGVLSLTDAKGRTFLVPAATLAYVEIGEESSRRVGFIA